MICDNTIPPSCNCDITQCDCEITICENDIDYDPLDFDLIESNRSGNHMEENVSTGTIVCVECQNSIEVECIYLTTNDIEGVTEIISTSRV